MSNPIGDKGYFETLKENNKVWRSFLASRHYSTWDVWNRKIDPDFKMVEEPSGLKDVLSHVYLTHPDYNVYAVVDMEKLEVNVLVKSHTIYYGKNGHLNNDDVNFIIYLTKLKDALEYFKNSQHRFNEKEIFDRLDKEVRKELSPLLESGILGDLKFDVFDIHRNNFEYDESEYYYSFSVSQTRTGEIFNGGEVVAIYNDEKTEVELFEIRLQDRAIQVYVSANINLENCLNTVAICLRDVAYEIITSYYQSILKKVLGKDKMEDRYDI